MKKFYLLAVLFLFITVNLNAQSTTIKLPTADNASSFNVFLPSSLRTLVM